jgi:branched-chain amino acid aminotransferase
VRAVRGGTGAAKTGGNYAASLFVAEAVARKGYQQVLWLDGIERKYVEEVGAMNIAFAYGKHIVTPALTGTILPGITRDSVLKLAPDIGYTISEERLDVHTILKDIEAGKITEAFGIGTAAVVAPVGRFGYEGKDYTVGAGETGPVATHLRQALTDLQYGRAPDPYGWTMKIEVGK